MRFLILVFQSLIVVGVISVRNWIEFICESLDITIALRKIDHNNLIHEVHSEKLGFGVCAFIFVSENLWFEEFLHCGNKNIMNTDETFAEMALAIQQLTHAVTRLEINHEERNAHAQSRKKHRG